MITYEKVNKIAFLKLCGFDPFRYGFMIPTLELGGEQEFRRQIRRLFAGASYDWIVTDDLVPIEGSGKSILPVPSLPVPQRDTLRVSGISLDTIQMVMT